MDLKQLCTSSSTPVINKGIVQLMDHVIATVAAKEHYILLT